MKTTRPIAILLALSAIAALTADASAYYHPTVGRFITRDPGPGRNSSPPAATAHFPPRDPSPGGSPRPVTVVPATTTNFLPHDPTGTNQYADGMNLYEYVGSRPIGLTDPTGKKAKTCERVLSVTPGTSGAWHWVDSEWYLFAIIPDPDSVSVVVQPGARGVHQPKGLYAARYVELFKCCDASDCPTVKWGKPVVALAEGKQKFAKIPMTTHQLSVPLFIPLPYGASQKIADLGSKLSWTYWSLGTYNGTGPDKRTIKWNDDYRMHVPTGYKLVEHITCDKGPPYWWPSPDKLPKPPRAKDRLVEKIWMPFYTSHPKAKRFAEDMMEKETKRVYGK